MPSYASWILISILFLALVNEINSSRAIYILGDSTSIRVVNFGLSSLYNCSKRDPRIEKSIESIQGYGYENNTGLICDSAGLARVGYHCVRRCTWDINLSNKSLLTYMLLRDGACRGQMGITFMLIPAIAH